MIVQRSVPRLSVQGSLFRRVSRVFGSRSEPSYNAFLSASNDSFHCSKSVSSFPQVFGVSGFAGRLGVCEGSLSLPGSMAAGAKFGALPKFSWNSGMKLAFAKAKEMVSLPSVLSCRGTFHSSSKNYASRKERPSDNMLAHRNILDYKRRLLAANYELRRKLYKALCRDPDLPSHVLERHRYKLSKLPRNSSFTRVRNRCIFTGRPRSVYEKFRMSRIVFRELASRGALMGIKKASW